MPGSQQPFYISKSINEQLMCELMSGSSYAQGLDLAVWEEWGEELGQNKAGEIIHQLLLWAKQTQGVKLRIFNYQFGYQELKMTKM